MWVPRPITSRRLRRVSTTTTRVRVRAGRWVGNASPGLGLGGEVSGEDLRAVLAGLAPGTGLTPNGEQLRAHPRRVPGFDLTFSVPKSVSVAYALGDPLVQGAVVEAGEAAVADALAWLEREACHVRRGTNRRDAKVPRVEGWGHAGSPAPGSWLRSSDTAPAGPATRNSIGTSWWPTSPRARTVDGRRSTPPVCTDRSARRVSCSRRRCAASSPLGSASNGRRRSRTPARSPASRSASCGCSRSVARRSRPSSNAWARQDRRPPKQATLATRKPKATIDADGIVARWQHEAETAGWGPTQLDALLAGTAPRAQHGPVDIEQLAAVVADRLIEKDSTFTRHDVTQAVASVMQRGATAADVDRLTAGVLAHPEIVTIHDPATLDRPAGWEQRYTTRRLIALETELSDAIASGVASHTGALAPDGVTVACAVASLGDDQQAAVTRLCTQGNAIEVLVGRAGTGKTYTLAAVASAYRAAGWNMIGVAPSARAARELETGAHIPAFTVPRFDHHINHHPLTANTVVVVDEAGMCGTVDLHHVVTTARGPARR